MEKKLPEKYSELQEMLIYSNEMVDQYKWGIVQRIYEETFRQGMSIRQLSINSEVSYTHIYKMMRGKNRIGLDILIKLAYGLGKSPGYFFPEETQAPKTDGDRFDEIVRDMDLQSRNYLLDFSINYSKECKRLKEKGERSHRYNGNEY